MQTNQAFCSSEIFFLSFRTLFQHIFFRFQYCSRILERTGNNISRIVDTKAYFVFKFHQNSHAKTYDSILRNTVGHPIAISTHIYRSLHTYNYFHATSTLKSPLNFTSSRALLQQLCATGDRLNSLCFI